MIVLDAYAVLALLKDEPGARQVQSLVSGRRKSMLTSIGVAEVLDHLVRLTRVDEEEAVLDLAQLGLEPAVVVGPGLASSAGLLRARGFNRRTCQVSMADCIAAEAARSLSAPLATSDAPLLDLCHREGINVLPLPDTKGRTWSPRRSAPHS